MKVVSTLLQLDFDYWIQTEFSPSLSPHPFSLSLFTLVSLFSSSSSISAFLLFSYNRGVFVTSIHGQRGFQFILLSLLSLTHGDRYGDWDRLVYLHTIMCKPSSQMASHGIRRAWLYMTTIDGIEELYHFSVKFILPSYHFMSILLSGLLLGIVSVFLSILFLLRRMSILLEGKFA